MFERYEVERDSLATRLPRRHQDERFHKEHILVSRSSSGEFVLSASYYNAPFIHAARDPLEPARIESRLRSGNVKIMLSYAGMSLDGP